MYKRIIKSFFVLFVLPGLLIAGGKYAGAFMELGVGARPLSLGGAAAALEGTGETFYYNPASLGLLSKPYINLMFAPTFGSLTSPLASYNYIGIAYPLPGGGTVSFNWTRFSVDDIPIYPDLSGNSFTERNTNLNLRPTGEPLGYIEDVEDVYYFTFAKTLESLLSLGWWYGDLPIQIPFGINFKLLRQKLGDASASGLGVDLGLMVKFNLGVLLDRRYLGDLCFGLSLNDATKTAVIWNTQHEDRIHQTILTGFTYQHKLWFSDAKLNLYYTYYQKYNQVTLFGIEFAIKALAIRLGSNDAGLTAGAGFGWWKLKFDYAFTSNSFSDVHRLSCSFSL